MLTRDNREAEKDIRMSMDRVIDLVREVRNGLINDFLNEDTLNEYFREHYSKELSRVKAEFLKRDLRELRDSAVDLPHYGLLIKQIQEQNSASLTASNHELFFRELETIFKKYNY